jgi:hypothetical protein
MARLRGTSRPMVAAEKTNETALGHSSSVEAIERQAAGSEGGSPVLHREHGRAV